jgi:hypothetical protein
LDLCQPGGTWSLTGDDGVALDAQHRLISQTFVSCLGATLAEWPLLVTLDPALPARVAVATRRGASHRLLLSKYSRNETGAGLIVNFQVRGRRSGDILAGLKGRSQVRLSSGGIAPRNE